MEGRIWWLSFPLCFTVHFLESSKHTAAPFILARCSFFCFFPDNVSKILNRPSERIALPSFGENTQICFGASAHAPNKGSPGVGRSDWSLHLLLLISGTNTGYNYTTYVKDQMFQKNVLSRFVYLNGRPVPLNGSRSPLRMRISCLAFSNLRSRLGTRSLPVLVLFRRQQRRFPILD